MQLFFPIESVLLLILFSILLVTLVYVVIIPYFKMEIDKLCDTEEDMEIEEDSPDYQDELINTEKLLSH